MKRYLKIRYGLSKRCNGFVLIDLLVALSITSILLIVMWDGFYSASNTILRLPLQIEENIEIMQIKKVISEYAGRIRTPYFYRNHQITAEADKLEINFLDGIPDKYLSVTAENDKIIIKYGEGEYAYKGLENCSVKPEKNHLNMISGISLTFNSITVIADFSSILSVQPLKETEYDEER